MHRLCALVLMMAFLVSSARAQTTEVYKCKDASGRWTYTNDRRQAEKQKCEIVSSQVNVAPAQKPQAAAKPRPGSFPRETAGERVSRAANSRDILEKELATEQDGLAKAKQALAEQESIRTGDERNYARVLERLQPYKDTVETHEKNIEALRRELNNLQR